MVHSMLFTNCVKEQCYQEEAEEENANKQTHIHVRVGTHTHTQTQQDQIENKIQKKHGLQGQPFLFAGVSNWQLIIQVVINIKAGDNMGRKACSGARPQESRRMLLPPLLLSPVSHLQTPAWHNLTSLPALCLHPQEFQIKLIQRHH